MSTIPLTDDCVAEEMKKAEERAYCVREEIRELKKMLNDFFCVRFTIIYKLQLLTLYQDKA